MAALHAMLMAATVRREAVIARSAWAELLVFAGPGAYVPGKCGSAIGQVERRAAA